MEQTSDICPICNTRIINKYITYQIEDSPPQHTCFNCYLEARRNYRYFFNRNGYENLFKTEEDLINFLLDSTQEGYRISKAPTNSNGMSDIIDVREEKRKPLWIKRGSASTLSDLIPDFEVVLKEIYNKSSRAIIKAEERKFTKTIKKIYNLIDSIGKDE